MDIVYRIRGARNLTPTEQHLANTVLAMGERVQDFTIKELASATSTSIASIHRLCRKLGLEGYKELKVELARSEARRVVPADAVDINFPFKAGETARDIGPRMELLYAKTLRETREMLDADEIDRAAELIDRAGQVDIYTTSHNLYPANMFCDRLLSAGRSATCHESLERLAGELRVRGGEPPAPVAAQSVCPHDGGVLPLHEAGAGEKDEKVLEAALISAVEDEVAQGGKDVVTVKEHALEVDRARGGARCGRPLGARAPGFASLPVGHEEEADGHERHPKDGAA